MLYFLHQKIVLLTVLGAALVPPLHLAIAERQPQGLYEMERRFVNQMLQFLPGTKPELLQEDPCPRNCTELNPETAVIGCPPFRRGLGCSKYTVYHYYRRCLVATVFCRRNLNNSNEAGVYVAATGTDLIKNETGLFILPYMHPEDGPVAPLVIEKTDHGGGGKGELVCGENDKWILYDTAYRFEVDHLFCLSVQARNLNYLLDLKTSGSERVTAKPFRRHDRTFFNV